jgi:glyoxylase-like metal-dependent hydrolase (beta-lactamase superfamily II)
VAGQWVARRIDAPGGEFVIFKPYYAYETGCAGYLLGCGGLGRCAVIDPLERDVEAYITFAQEKKMRITHVIETHVHADHRSGGRALAECVSAAYCLHRSADVALPFQSLDDGEELELGNTRLRVLHTPGHTPESICLVGVDLRRGPEPWFALTGDTLFSGAVGRPDLPGHARENAGVLHDSLHQKILSLPDALEVYPAHFGGSACGVGLSGKPSTTLAFEKRFNPLLSMPREAFVDALLASPAEPVDAEPILRFNRGR